MCGEQTPGDREGQETLAGCSLRSQSWTQLSNRTTTTRQEVVYYLLRALGGGRIGSDN